MGILASLFQSKTPAPTDDFWYRPFGAQTESGVQVSNESAMRVAAVYACVRILSETVGTLPLVVYRRTSEGKEKAPDHPLYDVLHNVPNNFQTSAEWREMQQGNLALRGNSYDLIIPGSRGAVDQLVPLSPDRMRVEVLSDNRPRYVYMPERGNDETYIADEIMHVKGMTFNGYVGMNPIEFQRESIGLAQVAEAYGARFFKNDTTARQYLSMSGTFKDAASLERFKTQWRESQGGRNQHSTPVLENGMELKTLGLNNADAQYIELRRYQVEDIARMFRIPLHMIGELSHATFSNIEHQGIEFVVHTLRPWLVKWEQAIHKSLIIAKQTYFAEFLVDGLLRGDIQSRYNAYQSGVNTGWLTRNEVREMENKNQLAGLDKPLVQGAMVDGENVEAQQAQEVMRRQVERVVHKEVTAVKRNAKLIKNGDFSGWAADFYKKHASFVAETLAMDSRRAEMYCTRQHEEITEAFGQELGNRGSVIACVEAWPTTKPRELFEMATY